MYQGFSVAFDMSFEEIWISYLVGATLWIAPKEIATNPESLPVALAEHGVTVLHAVPTLLALFERDVESLRVINLGGEACPESLVGRWVKPGRQVFNSYGPSEATVSASMTELQPGQPVTIGAPLPNYGLVVIDTAATEGLRVLPRGEVGELCITGPGVSLGYLGRPELTAEKFLANPWATSLDHARLYRTGDLARIDEDGRVHCLGRTDDQIKIRGFRVELGEIEATLTRQPGIGTAAVILRRDDGVEQLIAFVVPDGETPTTPAALRSALRDVLPPYMVPGHFQFVDEMPRLISGKIDRKGLQATPLSVTCNDTGDSDVPQSPAEHALFAALATLFPGQPLRREHDFFYDLGGHSLLAARLASALRADPAFAHATVRNIYEHRTLAAIAEALAAGQQHAPVTSVERARTSTLKRWLCGTAQAAAVPVLIAIRMGQWLAPFFTYHYFTGDPTDSVAFAITASILVFLLTTLLEFVIAIAGKWLIAGGIKPGRYPLWGMTYFRWWLADRLLEGAPVYLLSGSSLYSWWLRALGARIGRNVMIGSMTLRAPELLSIGDGVSIGNAVNLENARVQHGYLHLGRIELADHAYIGSYAVLEGNVRIEEDGHLEGQSALAEGEWVPAGEIWTGSPARKMGNFDATNKPPRPIPSATRRWLEYGFYFSGALLVATLFFLPIFPCFMLIDKIADAENFAWLQSNSIGWQLAGYFILALPANAILIICTAFLSAAIRWGVLPKMKPGTSSVHSARYYGKWFVNQIQESSLNVLHGVYATIYAPLWYRLLGANVGRNAEISTALGVVPDMLTLGDETFIADAVMLGDEEIDGGWLTIRPTVISRRSFIGNGAYVPDGTVVPEDVLIGVHSRVPDNERMRSGDTWLGTPAIHLPAREQQAEYPRHLTFAPSLGRRIARGTVEAFRILAPHAIVTSVGYTVVLDVMTSAASGRWANVLWQLTFAGLCFGFSTFAFIAILKWALMGRYRACKKPMWTSFVWFSEAVTNLYEGVTVPNFMRYLRGTPLLPPALNLLGCHIGKNVYMDTTDITEFDCVTIGDHSEINALACPQTHLFEDRIMKIDHVHIGDSVYLGPRSSVLFGARVNNYAELGPLTLVMKGEHIPGSTRWTGCPAGPATSL